MGVYLIFGKEDYLVNKKVDEFKESLNKNFLNLNFTLINNENYENYKTIVNACESVAFMDKKRIVLVNLDLFSLNLKESVSDDVKNLINYLENPPETVILIFKPSAVDKRSKLYKKIKKDFKVLEFEKLDKVEFSTWIGEKFKERKIIINNSQKELFISKTGYFIKDGSVTLYNIENEIEKISLNLKKGNSEYYQLKMEDIKENVVEVDENNIFKLIDNIFLKNRNLVYTELNNILKIEDKNVFIFLMIAREVSNLIKISYLLEKSKSIDEIASLTSLQKFAVRKEIARLKTLTRSKLIELYNFISIIDEKIKNDGLKEHLGLILVIEEILKF